MVVCCTLLLMGGVSSDALHTHRLACVTINYNLIFLISLFFHKQIEMKQASSLVMSIGKEVFTIIISFGGNQTGRNI